MRECVVNMVATLCTFARNEAAFEPYPAGSSTNLDWVRTSIHHRLRGWSQVEGDDNEVCYYSVT